MTKIKVLLVAENISQKMGGEAAKNLIYFKKIKEHRLDIEVVCHSRVKSELETLLSPEDFSQFSFIEDSIYQKILWQASIFFPQRIRELVFSQLIFVITQIKMRKLVKQIKKDKDIQLVFQPTPNTPKSPSSMYGLEIPIVIGPLKGGMEFPPAFQDMDSSLTRNILKIGKNSSNLLQKLMPGKLLADILLVGDQQTKELLPLGYQGKLYEILECGVDLKLYKNQVNYKKDYNNKTVKFIFTGRLVDWKGVQFLLEAFKISLKEVNGILEIIGDGNLRPKLEQQAQELGISQQVNFTGWLTQEDIVDRLIKSDVFVMPSLRESCGNSILEAMAVGLPVIATNWGGPSRILDSSCGKLVNPDSKSNFIQSLANEMIELSNSPDTRQRMGEASRQRLKDNYFDWDSKIKRIIEIFNEALENDQYKKK